MKLKQLTFNALLFAVSLTIALVLAEFSARIALNPADYLSVELKEDPILGAAPSRSTAGGALDAWGFRNAGVPHSVEVVAIGDSHTYGNTATMTESWPHVLQELTHRPVYNMGLGGYGPNQYRHLLTKALTLKPKRVVVGLYMGDDFENAFKITYGLDHWRRLRTLSPDKVDFNIWATEPPASFNKSIRIWLSRHSVIYQLVFHGPLLGTLQGETQVRNASWISPDATSLTVPEAGILEAFRPKGLLQNLDQSSPSVQEGMRITFELLGEMKEQCRREGVDMVVAVIPTKEMVFAYELEERADLPLAGVVHDLLANERKARDRTIEALQQKGIDTVDTLPALRAARGNKLYARTAADMHPGGNGYRVIAQSIAEALAKRTPPPRP